MVIYNIYLHVFIKQKLQQGQQALRSCEEFSPPFQGRLCRPLVLSERDPGRDPGRELGLVLGEALPELERETKRNTKRHRVRCGGNI